MSFKCPRINWLCAFTSMLMPVNGGRRAICCSSVKGGAACDCAARAEEDVFVEASFEGWGALAGPAGAAAADDPEAEVCCNAFGFVDGCAISAGASSRTASRVPGRSFEAEKKTVRNIIRCLDAARRSSEDDDLRYFC